MAEINNSLALGVKNDAPDIGKTLLTAGQIKEMQAKTALEEASTTQTQQNTDYNAFQQAMPGNNGLRTPDANTATETEQKKLDIGGRIGSILEKDQSLATRKQAIQMSHMVGRPVDPEVEKHLLTAPASQVKQYGLNMQRGGQSAASNMETSGDVTRNQGGYIPQGIPENTPIISRTEAATGGRQASPVKQMTDTIVPNADGSLPTVPKQPAALAAQSPRVVRNPDGSISSSVTPETKAVQESLGEDYKGYKEAAKGAALTKTLIHGMNDDVDRLSTGKGATFTNTVKQWLQSAQSLPGVGKTIKDITGDQSNPIAAFEALQKSSGQLTRATLKDVGGTAAAEYSAIQKQLPNVEMSERGIKLVNAQLLAPEDFKHAKLSAADNWRSSHGQSLDGFENDWNKNISPSAFLFARLPTPDRDVLIKNLNKTPEGRSRLQSIKTQAQWAHDNKLDWVLD